jgi:hypothetical protein
MSLRTAVDAVLKTMQKGLWVVTKLERGQSSTTLEMMSTFSSPLGVSPIALVALISRARTVEHLSDRSQLDARPSKRKLSAKSGL